MNANGLKRKFDIEAYVAKFQEVKTMKSFCGGVQGGRFFQKKSPLAAGGKIFSSIAIARGIGLF
jgi:hypothetical protein